tara:strand:+ start:391 stop:558 length:168 start_codon:yes stop_codon:yes gene_type:complete
MKVYCVLGIEYLAGITPIAIPKIYGVYLTKVDAYTARDKINSESKLSISEITVNN